MLACFGILFVVGTMSGCAATSMPMDKEQKVALGLIGAAALLSFAATKGKRLDNEGPDWATCNQNPKPPYILDCWDY